MGCAPSKEGQFPKQSPETKHKPQNKHPEQRAESSETTDKQDSKKHSNKNENTAADENSMNGLSENDDSKEEISAAPVENSMDGLSENGDSKERNSTSSQSSSRGSLQDNNDSRTERKPQSEGDDSALGSFCQDDSDFKNPLDDFKDYEITKAAVSDRPSSIPIAKNTYTVEVRLPKIRDQQSEVPVGCPRGSAGAKWPIACFVNLDKSVNVNAHHGGGAALVTISNAYGGKGGETTSQIFLLRFGFDGNHAGWTSISSSHEGHFGSRNTYETDESGKWFPDCMFGTNHVAVMANIPKYGDLSHGCVVGGDNEGKAEFPLNVNGQSGCGASLVLCSGWNDDTLDTGVYMIRFGRTDNYIRGTFIKGQDKWKFDCNEDGILVASGLKESVYGIFHNRDNFLSNENDGAVKGKAYTSHAQAVNGEISTAVFKTVVDSYGCLVVLCSHSSGIEDSTSAAVYYLTICENELKYEMIAVCHGESYDQKKSDLWSFTLSDNTLKATGPKGPCRYAVISNYTVDIPVAIETNLNLCLATGEADPIKGVARATKEDVVGWVTKRCDVLVTVNEVDTLMFLGQDLQLVSGRYAFHSKWTSRMKPGLHNVRVYAVRQNLEGEPVQLELEESPIQVVVQPPGVVLAVNCGSQSYQATTDIVYTSEFTQFMNLDPNYVHGTRCKALGCIKHGGSVPQILCNTEDGFLYARTRTEYAEAVDEKKVVYRVDGIVGTDYILRWHTLDGDTHQVYCNAQQITELLNRALSKEKHGTYTAHQVDVPVKIQDFLEIRLMSSIAGFALLTPDYKEKKKTQVMIDLENDEKEQLSQKTEPLTRTLTRKARQIVGWSANLIENASAETGNLSHWNISGNWQVHEGGCGAEKCFITSHMACTKYQEIDLTDHFATEYLDTAPPIQVFEYYREGVCGGGYYKMTVKLLDKDGKTVTEYAPPKSANLYKQNVWQKEGTTFSDYGPGVTRVTFESYGQDDKYWGGHYGPLISNATVRVKRETKPDTNDVFADIIHDDSETALAQHSVARDKLVANLLAEHQDLLEMDDTKVEDLSEPSGSTQAQVSSKVQSVRKFIKKRKKREIRVFVSSTFRDFKAEREELIKKTFREINNVCKDRGVFFTYVDLRWGITEDQTTKGETISICLQEIERCRPYFICMMGQRFGWSQKGEKEDALLDSSFDYAVQNFPKTMGWVDKFRQGHSVTTLEIMHGVLNDVDNHRERSFFYMRAPITSGKSETELKAMAAESGWHSQKQEAFKEKIRSTAGLNVRDYTDPIEVCDMVKQDLLKCIEEDFPAGTELSPLERERDSHVAFAEARRRVYIGREEYFNEINAYMITHKPHPLVILGESGSGKSALVANWVGRIEEQEKSAFVFVHFIGSSAESASYIKLLRRLFEEIKQYFGFQLQVPSVDNQLVRELPTWLKMAGARAKCVIVFDALNQLDDGSGTNGPEHDLLWLPQTLPPNVYMLLSTLPGKAFDAVKSREWPSMQVEPLDVTEKEKIVTGYLEGIYGKTLNDEQKDLIVGAEQTNNPLYLRALLDEVRVFGSFRNLTSKIKEYLAAANPAVLFAKILTRLEEDFEKGENSREGLVRDTSVAIWCSNKGMTEAELVEFLDLPNAVWSPIYLSLIENLVNRNGILNFFHDHLRQAVENKYLPTPEEKLLSYKKLAAFFENRPIDDRKVDELPFLLAKAGELEKLRVVISDLEVFQRLVKTEDGKFNLIKSWKLLGEFTQAETAYMGTLKQLPDSITREEFYLELLFDLAEFFTDLGLFQAARTMFEESILKELESKYRKSHGTIVCNPGNQSRKYRCNHPSVLDVLHKLGNVCMKQKDFRASEEYYTEAISRQNQLTKPSQKLQLAEGLLGKATIYFLTENMIDSKIYLTRAKELATDVLGSRHHFVAAITNKLGQLSYQQGRVDEALAFYVQDLTFTRADVGTEHPRMASIMNDIALVYDDKNNKLAGDLYEAALIILLDTYGNQHIDVAITRYNLGAFYFATNSFKRAQYQFTEALKIYTMFLGEDHPDTKEAQSALNDVSAFV